VAREASHEARGLGFQPHGARSLVILCEIWLFSGSSTKNYYFFIYFDCFNAIFGL
jgi:hypothetical protein